MNFKQNRRDFLRKSAITGASLGISSQNTFSSFFNELPDDDIKVGIVGLDTSHSTAFTKLINDPEDEAMKGYRVTAAYPYGSRTIESSYRRIGGYIDDMKGMGVNIVDSIQTLLNVVDVVLLETNDGNLHLEQSLEVFQAGKPVFIDKPVAGSLKDAVAIYKNAEKYNVPVFSSSSLRWSNNSYELRNGTLIGKIIGADTYSPARIEPSHPDLFWYGIHGVESLFTVMGTGCKEVVRIHHPDTDIVVGTWNDGRIGTFRGIRNGKGGYGGNAFGENGIHEIGPYEGYRQLVVEIINFFNTGEVPVSSRETIEIFAFMEAADESKRRGGRPVKIETVLETSGGNIN